MTTANNYTKHLASLALRGGTHWLARRARMAVVLATLLAIVALASGPPGVTRAQGAEQTVNGALTIVNNGPGDQLDPHISGALVAYTSSFAGNSEIRYHNLLTGADASIPTNGGMDFLPDVSGATIVYTHLTADRSAIYAFDTSTSGPPVELDPQPASNRRLSAIGSRTVAWVDLGFFASTLYPEIVAYDRTTQTASVGAKTFTVHAADNAGNTASRSVSYTVAYNLCVLYDQSKAHRLGSTVPIKLQLCDASGANMSSSSIAVHATGLTKRDNTASSVLDDSSNANPDNDFRYDATLGGTGGYIYNLSTQNLSTGTWVLSFTAAGDPTTHTVQFDVR